MKRSEVKVVRIHPIPGAKHYKNVLGSYAIRVLYELEDGRQIQWSLTARLLRDLKKKIAVLPADVDNKMIIFEDDQPVMESTTMDLSSMIGSNKVIL